MSIIDLEMCIIKQFITKTIIQVGAIIEVNEHGGRWCNSIKIAVVVKSVKCSKNVVRSHIGIGLRHPLNSNWCYIISLTYELQ